MHRFLLVVLWLAMAVSPVYAQMPTTVHLPFISSASTSGIKPCIAGEMAALNNAPDNEAMPDNPSDAGCLLPSETFPGDMHSLIYQGDPNYESVQASALDYWTWPRRVALYRLDCNVLYGCGAYGSTSYINGALGLFPAGRAYLPGGRTWSDHFVGNWVSIGPPGVGLCPGDSAWIRPHVLVGIGIGRFSSSYYSTTTKIFAERYSPLYGCSTTVVTGYNPSSSDIHHLQLYKTGGSGGTYNTTWTARYWRAGQWYYIFENQLFEWDGWYMMIGGESGSDTLAHADLPTVDLQYISKIRVQRSDGWFSYHDKNMGYLSGDTTKQADSPAVMIDWNTGYSFVSLGWVMN